MADMNNFEDIKEGFNYITDILDSMRAQNAMNAGGVDKVLLNINTRLESLSNEENSDLIKVFLAELKRSLEERHNFVSSKFNEIETSFKELVHNSEDQIQKHEIKEVFEIIANNLNIFSQDFSSQKELISEIGLKIEELQKDDSPKKEILRNISVLKVDLEKFSNGFESIIIKLNDKFKDLSQTLINLDSSESLGNIKKDIENIFLSSNAVLSTLQVIDRKNRELEDVITNVVTKDDFKLEREQVAKLIAQNIQITDYMNALPTKVQVETLTERIDGTVGVINALKNMLSETGKQNQQMLTAQLDNLESKILNISTEDEFIGFRKELSEFAQEVIQSTSLMRADLAETNSGLKDLVALLDDMDIKNTFESFGELTRVSENNIRGTIVGVLGDISKEIEKNKSLTSIDIIDGVSNVNEKIESVKKELSEGSKSNLSNILEHIQSVINNIFSIKNTLHIENLETAEAIEDKLQDLKEDLVASNNFIVQNSQENLENILSNVEKVFKEITTVKENLDETASQSFKNIGGGFSQISKRIGEIKEELNQNSKENFSNILSIVDDFSQQISGLKISLEQSSQENSGEIKGFIENLSEKLFSLQDGLKEDSNLNTFEIKGLLEELNRTFQSMRTSLEQTSSVRYSGLKSGLEELSLELKSAQENFDVKSQTNLSKIVSLFEDLSNEFNAHKQFLSESTQVNFETLSLYIQNLNQKFSEAKNDFSEGLRSNFAGIQNAISVLPETIKENQAVFENEKKALIEENSKNIEDMSEKIQILIKGIIAKDNPFKSEVLYEFAELKSKLDVLKEDLNQSNQELGDVVGVQINDCIENFENLMVQYNERHNSALISLQNKLIEYFQLLQQSAQENDLKLETSFKATSEIKTEVQSIIESLFEMREDPTLNDLSAGIGEHFGEVLENITQLEEKISIKNSESLKIVSSNLEAKFDVISKDLKMYKNFTSSEINQFVEELEEKTEILKGLLSLTSTDILNSLVDKTDEIVSSMFPISESIEKIVEMDFKQMIVDIKNQIDSSYFSITSIIKEDVKIENEEQLEKLSHDFENLNEKLETIITKVVSYETNEFGELKSILNEFAPNIEFIPTTLAKINETKEVFFETHAESKAEIINKIAKAHEETEMLILNELGENLNEKLETIITKVVSYETNEFGELKSILNEFAPNIEFIPTTLAKINETKEVFFETHAESKAEIINKIAKAHEETEMLILNELGENINLIKEVLVSLSPDKTIIEEISQKTVTLQAIVQSASKGIEGKIATLEENYQLSIQSLLSEAKTSFYEKTEDNIDELKSDLLDKFSEITDSFELAISSITVKEELQGVSDDIKASLDNLLIDIKNQIDSSYLSITSTIKEDVRVENEEQLEKLSHDFENLNEKLETIITKVVSYETNEFGELKSILNEFAPNIEFIPTTLAKINETKEVFFETQAESKAEIINKIAKAHEETEMLILNELGENINLIKEVLVSLSPDKTIIEEISQKTGTLQAIVQSASKGIEGKIATLEENYQLSIQSLLSEAKTSFYEKTEDNIDELKSFIEIIETKKDFSADLDKLKSDVFDKFSEMTDSFELSISSISVKDELHGLHDDIKVSLDNLFDNIEEKFVSSIENNPSISNIFEKSEEIVRRIENLKTAVTDDITEKLDVIELNMDNQKKDFFTLLDEIKTSLAELQESYVDLSLNSTMEISSNLVTIQEKINNLQNKINESDLDEKIENIGNKLENIDFGQVITSIENKFNELDFDKSKEEIIKEFELINEKFDLLAVNSDSDVEENINEIKQILKLQMTFLTKLNKLEKIDSLPVLSDLESIKTEIKNFEEKLDASIKSAENGDKQGSIKGELDVFKEDVLGNLIDIFSQISFVAETEEIKDFIEEKFDDIKSEIKNLPAAKEVSNIDTDEIKDFIEETGENVKSSLESNFNNILSSLDILQETTNSVKNNLEIVRTEEVNEPEYSYTLQDIESDIAKVRLILKDISQAKSDDNLDKLSYLTRLDDLDKLSELDKLNEDITSLSSRTNKILLNSDESNTVLKSNLDKLRNVVHQFEDRVKHLDNRDSINRVEHKLENINNLMLSSVKSDKIFNQTFTYLAEWIDSTSENLGNIAEQVSEVGGIKQSIIELKKVIPKAINIENVLDEISKKFNEQQEKINSLEDKIEKLIKENRTKNVDIKSVIKEILAQVQIPEVITDAKLTKKVDNIDKQLAKLSKGIEKITSYVD